MSSRFLLSYPPFLPVYVIQFWDYVYFEESQSSSLLPNLPLVRKLIRATSHWAQRPRSQPRSRDWEPVAFRRTGNIRVHPDYISQEALHITREHPWLRRTTLPMYTLREAFAG